MFKWKRKHEGNKFEYTLVLDDGSNGSNDDSGGSDNDNDEVIGRVSVIEDINSDITVIAECDEIGYKVTKEHVDMNSLKIIVCDTKKFIKEEFEKIEALR